jgi:hypothetical protein
MAATTCERPPVLSNPIVYQDMCPGDAGFASVVSAGGRDVHVKLPDDRQCTKSLLIKSAGNVHIVGGSFLYEDAAASVIAIQSSSGTTFIEGADIDANGRSADAISSYIHTGRVVIQNTSIRGVVGTSGGIIRDAIEAQTRGPLAQLKLQNVTLRTSGRGLFSFYSPTNGHGARSLQLDHVDAAYDPDLPPWQSTTPPRLLEIGDPASATYQAPPEGTLFSNVYVDGSHWNIAYNRTVYAAPRAEPDGCASFKSTKFNGRVCLGPPPSGDFAPPQKVGLNYDRTYFCGVETNACAGLQLGSGSDLGGMRPFPNGDPWNTDISSLPVHSMSGAIKASMGDSTGVGLRAEFGSGTYLGARIGIPYVVVPDDQPLVPIDFTAYGGDPGPYPVPPDAPVEGAGLPADEYNDNHVLVVQRDRRQSNCLGRLYELFRASPVRDGPSVELWQAASGAIFDLNAPSQRPAGSTSADAAGLPIFPGLVRYDEVQRAVARDGRNGVVPHAFRFTVGPGFSKWATVKPATHCAGWNAGEVPFGSRWRLRADWPVPDAWPAEIHVIINTLKKYGMIMADNGGQFFITGAPDERWDNDWLRHLAYIKGDDLDMVNTGAIEACTP